VIRIGKRKNLLALGRRRFGEHRGVALAYMRRRRLVGWDIPAIIQPHTLDVKGMVSGTSAGR
jgi:hypothetical protein